jgi:hypothetical protein
LRAYFYWFSSVIGFANIASVGDLNQPESNERAVEGAETDAQARSLPDLA